ncbi:MAG: 4Fe-4S dicluster domain-containing protein [Chloroflexota bacterium]
MSLLDAAERFASLDRSQVVLDSKACLHAQDLNSSCRACIEVCPVAAIAFDKSITLNSETCQGCLACLPVCPVGAIQADDDVASLLTCVTHIEDKTVELLCGLHPKPDTGTRHDLVGVRIGACLAGLGSAAYLSLAALGLEHIILRSDACDACKWAALKPEIEKQADHANHFLAAWNKNDPVVCLDQIETALERALWDAKNPPLSRRDLFRMLGRQGQVSMARAMENGVRTSERKPGRNRLRLVAAVAHLPEPVTPAAVDLEGFGFATLQINADCTACGACGKTCPTTALRFEKDADLTTFKILFSARSCIGCDLCLNVCAPDALELDHNPTFENIFVTQADAVVLTGELTRCEKCKTVMAARPGVRLCMLCEYRKTHPFGSILPADLKAQYKKTDRELRS